MSDLGEKVKTSIERLRAFEPRNGEGYYLAFSGGKDSVVCKALMDMAGVKYDATYRVTSVDPPELVRFIKEKHPDVKREIPHDKDGKPITMWNLIPKKLLPPMRFTRYCCSELKEDGGDGRKVVTGVRWAESKRREEAHGIVTVMNGSTIIDSNDFRTTRAGGSVLVNDNDESRKMVEQCYKRRKTTINRSLIGNGVTSGTLSTQRKSHIANYMTKDGRDWGVSVALLQRKKKENESCFAGLNTKKHTSERSAG